MPISKAPCCQHCCVASPCLPLLASDCFKVQAEELVTAAKLTLSLLILSGCTTTSDHCYVLPNDCTLDDTIRAAR